MSKAEELAEKTYPKIGLYDNLMKRKGFIEGYHQAEKDLELTWEDIPKIFRISEQLKTSWWFSQRMIREAARYEKEYRERIARYLDLRIEDVGIMVFVIPSVAEMAEEGEAMHHCVYTNEYFRKENCLILSARDGDGNRLETVEVNTKTWKIIQSRGLMNNPSPRHADIVRIVNENMNLLKAI